MRPDDYYHENPYSIRIASFDVGLKNLSLCVVDFNSQNAYQIRKWIIISLRGKNISDYTIDIVEKLREQCFGVLDYVLIEQQINRNTQMKVMSHVIQAFFICDSKIPANRIKFVSPKLRVDNASIPYSQVVQKAKEELGLGQSYTRREYKNLSIHICQQFLNVDVNKNWNEYFNSCNKKDDLADSFVQAMCWNYGCSIMDVD